MSRLSQFEISGEFLNSWTPDDKYAVPAAENLRFPIQMQLSSKENVSLGFLFNLWNLHQISNIFCQKNFVIPHVFPKLQTVKDLVRPLSKKRRFRTSFDSQLVKGSFNTYEICMKEPLSYFSSTLRENYS